jgi:RNA polymerase sigma-70 factor, ECF subfamily
MSLSLPGKNSDQESDAALLGAYLESGDSDLLGKLYSRYIALVYGVCLKYLGNRDEAKDAVMSIYEKVYIELERTEVQNFKSWLYVVTKNFCLMEIRSSKRYEGKTVRLIEEATPFMENEFELHPIDSDDAALDEKLHQCIEGLKLEQKRCVDLFYFKKMTYQQVASELKMEEKKVKSHLQNARRNLKICLEENYAEK